MNKTLADAMQKAIDSEEQISPILVEDYEVSSPIEPSTGQGVPHDSSEVIDEVVSTELQQQLDEVKEYVNSPIKVKGLDEKAVLISVKRNMYSPYKLDKEESKEYGAGNVNKHLFEGRDNRVKETISKFTEVYNYVKNNTVPWTTGVDMLNIEHYMEFTGALRPLVDEAYRSIDDLCTHWDDEVKADLDRLEKIAQAKGKPNLANAEDYPDVDELRSRFGIDIRYMPVPTTGDFRVGISDEDKASLQQQIDDAEVNATNHVIKSMVKPLESALKKLSVPIGKDGSVFRDTLVDNLVEVAERMNKINISDDDDVQHKIDELLDIGTTLSGNKSLLRSNQSSRELAQNYLNVLISKMLDKEV
jgi:hypothetical protein